MGLRTETHRPYISPNPTHNRAKARIVLDLVCVEEILHVLNETVNASSDSKLFVGREAEVAPILLKLCLRDPLRELRQLVVRFAIVHKASIEMGYTFYYPSRRRFPSPSARSI